MKIIENLDEWKSIRSTLTGNNRLGFAPTMGNLHDGHASLYRLSKSENDVTIASIFVNPTQFNRPDDFRLYPRTLEADLALLQNLGVDYCLLPSEQSLYPDGYHYQVHENALSQHMEGQYRPGHFNGVLTIVLKLLNLVKPHTAYFGEKDYQQYQLIRNMADAFFMDIEIKACTTIREPSGLAYSSRNNRLTPSQRNIAEQFAAIFHQKQEDAITLKALQHIGVRVEYLQTFQTRQYIAAYIDEIRLIDNYAL